LLKGASASTIAADAPSTGVYEWAIPSDFPVGSDYTIKITSVSDPAVSDASDSAFAIQEKTVLTVTSPVGGEYIEKGKPFPITWTTNGTGDFVIDLYRDRMPETTIVAKAGAGGTYSWTPSYKIFSGNTYTVRLASKTNPLVVFDESKNFFSIVSPILKAPVTQNFDTWNTRDSLMLLQSWEQTDDDELDWYIHTGPTPSRAKVDAGGTGPKGDHTSGKGNFVYLESSIPNNPSKNGNILSPLCDISGIGNVTIRFWYHMLSKEGRMGHMFVDLFADGIWHDSVAYFEKNQGDTWHEKVLTLADLVPQTPRRTQKIQLRFRGTTATDYDGDICIDDFSVSGDVVAALGNHVALMCRPRIFLRGNRINYHDAWGRLSVVLLDGSKVMEVTVNGSGAIDMAKYPHGVYCVKINNEIGKILR
jgi:hypothetical protein